MSYDAELLKLLRQASIEHSVLQLKLLHSYKQRMNEMLGDGDSSGILLPEKEEGKERRPRDGGETTVSDLVFELTRTSVLAWEQWLRLSSKQLDFSVGVLGRDRRRERDRCEDLQLEAKVKRGEAVEMPFRIRNPYPFRTRVSFGTLGLCPKDGKPWHPMHRVTRRDGAEEGDDFSLRSSEEGHFVLAVNVDEELAPGTYEGEASVLLERAVVGTLAVKITVDEDKG